MLTLGLFQCNALDARNSANNALQLPHVRAVLTDIITIQQIISVKVALLNLRIAHCAIRLTAYNAIWEHNSTLQTATPANHARTTSPTARYVTGTTP